MGEDRAPRAAVLALAAGLVTLAVVAVGSHHERGRIAPSAAQQASQSSRTVTVGPGGDLQAALDRAPGGDVIVLEAGAVYVGPFTVPRTAGDDWITIQSSALERGALPPGRRVDPSQAAHMPKLVSASGPVIRAAPGAHHVRLVGLELHPRDGVALVTLVELGTESRSLDDLPRHVVFERCYLHGDPEKGGRRGIALNARDAAVVDSHLADFKDRGVDTQAIAIWNSPGPIRIANNYLEGAGENVMVGGADPLIPDLVPSDIEIRANHMAKPLAWKPGEPGFKGPPWVVKNLFELKNARRVRIEGNLFEHNWEAGQNGFAILFTVRNQDGTAPWSAIEDVLFAGNVVRGTASGVNILGRDDLKPSQPARRIAIRDNLFDDVGGARWGGRGILFQVLNGAEQVVIEHNTAVQTGSIVMAEGPPSPGFVYRNNVSSHGDYGIIGTGTAPGRDTLRRYFPGAIVEGNVIAGGEAARYPAGNFFPASLDAVGFADRARGDYRLGDGRRYRGAARDRDPGVDAETLRSAQAASGR